MLRLLLNDQELSPAEPAMTPLLHLLRSSARSWGTREACRTGGCGSCVVLLSDATAGSYRAVNSCLVPLRDAAGRHVVSIEGLRGQGALTRVQQAIVGHGATQCGFCTSGVVLSLTGYFMGLGGRAPDEGEAIEALDGNLCRCTGYGSIKRAARALCQGFTAGGAGEGDLGELVQAGLLPQYFVGIPERLRALQAERPATRARAPAIEPASERLVAGGTALPRGLVRPGDATSALPEGPELRGIVRDGEHVFIGAAVTLAALQRSPLLAEGLPSLRRDLQRVASPPVRERATVGGNIASGLSSADLTVTLLALDASLHLREAGARREVSLSSYLAEALARPAGAPGPLIERVRLRLPGEGDRFNVEKVSKRGSVDVASVNTAICLSIEGGRVQRVRLSAGGVAATPVLLERAMQALEGQALSAELMQRAAQVAAVECSPVTDVRGSARYKRLLLHQLVIAHFVTLFPGSLSPGARSSGVVLSDAPGGEAPP